MGFVAASSHLVLERGRVPQELNGVLDRRVHLIVPHGRPLGAHMLVAQLVLVELRRSSPWVDASYRPEGSVTQRPAQEIIGLPFGTSLRMGLDTMDPEDPDVVRARIADSLLPGSCKLPWTPRTWSKRCCDLEAELCFPRP